MIKTHLFNTQIKNFPESFSKHWSFGQISLYFEGVNLNYKYHWTQKEA